MENYRENLDKIAYNSVILGLIFKNYSKCFWDTQGVLRKAMLNIIKFKILLESLSMVLCVSEYIDTLFYWQLRGIIKTTTVRLWPTDIMERTHQK